MKKLINATDQVVADALRGVEAAYGDRVRVSLDPYMIVRADAPVKGKVGLISGGGSGHEPMHGGYVGPGMLDAACPGEVFTSPTPDQMTAAPASSTSSRTTPATCSTSRWPRTSPRATGSRSRRS
jgi:phosphoenolpyruvate---glycerone phosphotransferase subunit DhaK